MPDDLSKNTPRTLEDIPTFTRKRRVDADIRKAKAIPMLLAGYTVKRIASEIGCSQETVKSWRRKDPLIKAILAGEAARTKQAPRKRLHCFRPEQWGQLKRLSKRRMPVTSKPASLSCSLRALATQTCIKQMSTIARSLFRLLMQKSLRS